jgi:hypothetical protein
MARPSPSGRMRFVLAALLLPLHDGWVQELWSVPLSGGIPKKELELVSAAGGIVLSRDVKSAIGLLAQHLGCFLQIWDVSTHQMLHQIAWDTSKAAKLSHNDCIESSTLVP